jgi:adenine-specific DNA-methyltransferase
MIYIDPPYNTSNDFIYEDDFTEDADSFLERDGQYDEQGNRLVKNLYSNGRFHTDWLNMLYPRLRIARDFLTEDGVIFISIDDNEADNLKKIANEVFGGQNFVAQLVR